MLKILQARLQQYIYRELPNIQAGFRKSRGTRDQIANIGWIMEKAREFQKNIYFCSVKEESEKVGLKLNIQKTKIMESGPITSWKIDGETMETVKDLFSWAPKSLQMVNAVIKLKDICSLEGKLWPNWTAY